MPPSVIFLGSALSCRSYPPPVLWPLTFLHSDCVCYCPGAGDSEQGDCPGRRCGESLPEKLLGSLTRGQHVGTWCGANAVKKKKKSGWFLCEVLFLLLFHSLLSSFKYHLSETHQKGHHPASHPAQLWNQRAAGCVCETTELPLG